MQDWTLQNLTMTDEFAGLDIAGLDNGGLDIDGLDNGGLDIDGLDNDGQALMKRVNKEGLKED